MIIHLWEFVQTNTIHTHTGIARRFAYLLRLPVYTPIGHSVFAISFALRNWMSSSLSLLPRPYIYRKSRLFDIKTDYSNTVGDNVVCERIWRYIYTEHDDTHVRPRLDRLLDWLLLTALRPTWLWSTPHATSFAPSISCPPNILYIHILCTRKPSNGARRRKLHSAAKSYMRGATHFRDYFWAHGFAARLLQ